MADLIIRGESDVLEELLRAIESEVGPQARPETFTSAKDGELREPVTIALIVALGGPALTHAIAGVLKRFMQHREIMDKQANERLAGERAYQLELTRRGSDGHERPVTVAELEGT